MKARVLTGSKREIAELVARIEGEVSEAIVFVEDAEQATGEDVFAEMERFTVQEAGVDDSRTSVYSALRDE